MQCVNPQCSRELIYLREGRLELLELEPHSRDHAHADEGGFPIKYLPSRFFWLCGMCSQTHFIRRWTSAGLVLESDAGKLDTFRTFSGGRSTMVLGT
jgi:hypothetical protein